VRWPPTAVADKRNDRKVSETAAQKMEGHKMAKTTEKANKVVVLKAFDALFSKRDYKAAERCWSPNYIERSAHIRGQMYPPQSGSVCRRRMK
jgi:hypothetical protein